MVSYPLLYSLSPSLEHISWFFRLRSLSYSFLHLLARRRFRSPMVRAHDPREYELTMRQEPKQARMCGVGGKGPFLQSLSHSPLIPSLPAPPPS
ncbi:hypothetical protein LXA43DRAFT_1056050 [Ganoderma leucocontextum]|nr:hypothetical protein LXA43DRAFT_1056050 [Ganoderma leucocontextum]